MQKYFLFKISTKKKTYFTTCFWVLGHFNKKNDSFFEKLAYFDRKNDFFCLSMNKF